jgi:hypothetical protein
MDTPDERVVGMQQKMARPRASSGGCSGREAASTAASGVTARMEMHPNVKAPAGRVTEYADDGRADAPTRNRNRTN